MSDNRGAASPILVRLVGSPPASMQLRRPLTIVGSKLHSHLRIVSPAISGSHALLLNLGNHVFLRDLMSRSHVYVNDREVAECRLKYGDVIRFADMSFRFLDSDVRRESLERIRPAPAALCRQGSNESVPLNQVLFVIGRQPGANLVLDEPGVSKAHAVIYEHDGHRLLRDLGSRHGTLVNGSPIRSARLRGGEVIRIGQTNLQFFLPGEAVSEQHSDVEAPEDETSDADTLREGHVFVSDPVIVSSPSELQPVAEDELLDSTELIVDRRESAAPSNWFADAGSGEQAIAPAPEIVPVHPIALTQDQALDELLEPEGAKIQPAEPEPQEAEDPPIASAVPVSPAMALLSEPIDLPAPSRKKENSDYPNLMAREVPSDLIDDRPPAIDLAEPSKPPSASSLDARPPVGRVGSDSQPDANPADPDSFDDFLAGEVLTLFPNDGPESTTPIAWPADRRRGRRRMILVFVTALAAMTILAAGGWYYLHRR